MVETGHIGRHEPLPTPREPRVIRAISVILPFSAMLPFSAILPFSVILPFSLILPFSVILSEAKNLGWDGHEGPWRQGQGGEKQILRCTQNDKKSSRPDLTGGRLDLTGSRLDLTGGRPDRTGSGPDRTGLRPFHKSNDDAPTRAPSCHRPLVMLNAAKNLPFRLHENRA